MVHYLPDFNGNFYWTNFVEDSSRKRKNKTRRGGKQW